ncbi:MAG: DNA primase, partial [Bacteroidota bacterium]|nr:DNA primase [Bacteroidota bacterium]
MILENGLNVRAISFPEGEDPDSYSRKLGTFAFQNFLKDNARDFITFKTLLFTENTANDPIKKAETIKEIIGTIAKVSDPVQRAVYIKECSSLLEINEAILISELNKIQIKKNKEQGIGSPATMESKIPETSIPEALTREQKLSHEDVVVLQERESIRLLISYGLNKFEEEFHIYDFLLSELEDIEFHTPVYREILDQFKKQLSQGKVPDAEFFIRNGSEEVRNSVINLISQKYDISLNWKNKFQIHIPRETDVLHNLVYTNILRLKFRIIQKLISENMEGLKKVNNQEDQERFLKIHSTLKKSEIEVAGQLGIVVNK